MARWRANHPLQAPSLGKLESGAEFEWSGSVIGWNVTPLDAEAKAMHAKAMERIESEGLNIPAAQNFEPVKPPKSGMQATAQAMTAHVDNPPPANVSAVSSSPQRRKLTPASVDDAPAAAEEDAAGDL